ncbi:hypothetical protein ERJ75_001551100 [Trypanosoma vivax]|nr:hypothetical protein ERJ75_001551100 [Trypanosoma vivax]
MHQPRESGYRAWRAQPVAQDKAWARQRHGTSTADEGARRDGSEEDGRLKRSLDMVGPGNKSEQGQGAGRQPPRLGKAHASEQADGHWLGLE